MGVGSQSDEDMVVVYDGDIAVADLYAQLAVMNTKFDKLIRIFEWIGKYDYIDDIVLAHTERKEYIFKFPVRSINISANQQITIQLHDIGNPSMTITTTEMPFILSNMIPNMTLNRIYITSGSFDTRLKMFTMG